MPAFLPGCLTLPLHCTLRGAAQAGVLGFGLFVFSNKVSALINVQALPDGYTV